jgi:hypothetical protein
MDIDLREHLHETMFFTIKYLVSSFAQFFPRTLSMFKPIQQTINTNPQAAWLFAA